MGTWTPELLVSRLTEAFRAMPGTAVWSPRADDLHPFRPSQQAADRAGQLALIAITSQYLGRDSLERQALLVHAQSEALLGPASEACRERGWNRSTFEERWRRGARSVCDGLNRDAAGLAVDIRKIADPVS